MRIMIVSEQPVNNICGMEEFQRRVTADNHAEIICLRYTAENADAVFRKVKSQNPELLITTDLSGFEQCTLTDNVAYNLLSCKQLHLLLHQNLPNERYLDRPLNIAMFFYCVGDEYCDYLRQRYPDLPYLRKLSGWQAETAVQTEAAQALYEAYHEVLRESLLQPCHTASGELQR